MPPVDAASLDAWCTDYLGSALAAELFRSGHLSEVIGVRLADAREIVVKVRPARPRVAACVEVHRRIFEAGFPCPAPIAGPVPLGIGVATAEAYVPGGGALPNAEHTAQLSARAFSRLIRLSPRPAEVALAASSAFVGSMNHGEAGLWPRPEGSEIDLNAVSGRGGCTGMAVLPVTG